MPKLKTSDVRHVARLAKLKLSQKEEKKFQKQLSDVVGYIAQLNEVDTSRAEPTSQTTGLKNVTRKDEINPIRTLSHQQALSGTEKVHNGYFVVPGVLENRTDY